MINISNKHPSFRLIYTQSFPIQEDPAAHRRDARPINYFPVRSADYEEGETT